MEFIQPNYKRDLTIQASAVFLARNAMVMDIRKLIALLYEVDREAIKRWLHPVTFDRYRCNRKRINLTGTSKILKKDSHFLCIGNTLLLQIDPGYDHLSMAYIDLIKEIDAQYKLSTVSKISDNQREYPEYKRGEYVTYEAMFRAVGLSEEEMGYAQSDFARIKHWDNLFGEKVVK